MALVAAAVNSRAGKGGLSRRPIRQARLLAVAAGLWLSLQLVLVVWWATVIERQARQLASLEALRSGAPDAAMEQWSRTRLMLMGESATSLALLLAVSLLLAWLYWREHRRARAMQAFFASVTHELRTPLTSIRLQAEAIADGEQRAEFAQRLLEDSLRLESQIDKTLELARIEGGGPLREQSIPLAGWLPRTLAEIAQTHGASLELQSSFSAELPPVLADTGALTMVLRNLIENSVRHGGVQPVSVRLAASGDAGGVRLEYCDNGRGVVPGAGRLGRLFGRGPQSSGAGVGLYLVRRLMQRMGGSVRFVSRSGEPFRAVLLFRTGL